MAFISLHIPGVCLTAGYYAWTPLLEKAYREATSLRLHAARNTLRSAAIEDANNLLQYHVAGYVDFFEVYISEDETRYKEYTSRRQDYLKYIEKNGNPNSPWHRFLLADLRLQWALVRLKFEDYTSAFFDTNKAFKLLTENETLFPDFMPNKKNLGILHAMAGTIPEGYQWAVEWFTSFEGTVEQGTRELQEVVDYAAKNPFIYEEEVYIYYTYLRLHLGNDTEGAWQIVNTARLNPRENPLHCFVLANIAMRTGNGPRALEILNNCPSGPDFFPLYYLSYMRGLVRLQNLDTGAEKDFEYFLTHFKGRHFIKDTYQKIAWCRLLRGDLLGYDRYMKQCLEKGHTVVGNDRSAYEEARRRIMPDPLLLKARLLFDGGYYQRAWELLQNRMPSDYISTHHQLELSYRKGRILQALGKYETAIEHFRHVIAIGREQPWYFACRAALEMGHVYEQLGDVRNARAAYQQCLSIQPEEHRTGLHQQAKAGLERLK